MKTIALISLVSVLGLTGCAAPIAGNNSYQSYESGVAQNVQYGMVESVRPVWLDKGSSGVGVGAGALLGGIAGSTIGHGWGSAAAGLAGAVAGGIAGQAVERNNAQTQGIEITVRLQNGGIIAVTQPADEQFYPRERVRLLTANGKTRITH